MWLSCLSYSSIKNIRYILLSVLSDIEPPSVLCVFVFSSVISCFHISYYFSYVALVCFVIILPPVLRFDFPSLCLPCLVPSANWLPAWPPISPSLRSSTRAMRSYFFTFTFITFILIDLTSLPVVNVRGMCECDRWAKATIFLITTTLSALWLLRWWPASSLCSPWEAPQVFFHV